MYDIIIIGGGPGGYVAAERAGALGKSVLLIEEAELGGVCLNWGCIPTKSLLNSAKHYHHAKHAQRFGVKVEGLSFDLETAMAWKNQTVKTLTDGVGFLMKKNKVEVVKGRGVLQADRSVVVDGTSYQAKSIIIATGSRAAMPPIPGSDLPHVVNNRGALSLKALPKQVAVIGGGVIGMEFASFFSSLEIPVSVFEMQDDILPMMEPALTKILRKSMSGIDFHLATQVKAIDKKGIQFEGPKGPGSFDADLVLMAVGRIPNTAGIGLEDAKIDVTRRGITVDEHMRTNIPGVYAVGDVTGMSLLAHSASRMGEVAVNHICSVEDHMRYDAIPWALYTDPEAAGCGLTQAQAKEQGYETQLLSFNYAANGRNLAENGKTTGKALLVVDAAAGPGKGKILGVHLLGAYASEQIAAAAVMLETDVRQSELQQIVFPHPTVAEVIREAAFE